MALSENLEHNWWRTDPSSVVAIYIPGVCGPVEALQHLDGTRRVDVSWGEDAITNMGIGGKPKEKGRSSGGARPARGNEEPLSIRIRRRGGRAGSPRPAVEANSIRGGVAGDRRALAMTPDRKRDRTTPIINGLRARSRRAARKGLVVPHRCRATSVWPSIGDPDPGIGAQKRRAGASARRDGRSTSLSVANSTSSASSSGASAVWRKR